MKAATQRWYGLLNFNKPAGWTSRQAVDHVKRLVKPAKIGHAGTLDPLATGVLVLCVGPATRLVPYLHDLPKTYRAEFLLGRTSPTDDIEVEPELIADAPVLSQAAIEAALPGFIGQIEQVPPAYSAVKLHGRRAYDLARRGREPDLKARTVHVQSMRLLAWEDPRLKLEIVCGSGTYIRAIGRDLARTLRSGAVMSALERTHIGPFAVEDAVCPEDVTSASLADHILPAQAGLEGMPVLTADDEMLECLQRGLRCPVPTGFDGREDEEVAILTHEGQLPLIAVVAGGGCELQPRHVFLPKSGQP